MNITLVSLVLQVITLMNLLFIIFTVFIERKKPVSALAWILVLTFLPLLGFVMYLIFGINIRLPNKINMGIKKYRGFLNNGTKQNELPDYGLLSFMDCSSEKYRDMIEMHRSLGRCEFSQDNEVTIFTSGQGKYEALINDIKNAACSIDMLYFIFKSDNIGRKIVEVLTKKAREGVNVRVIYDKRGSLMTPFKMFKELIRAGGKVCRIYPFKMGAYFKLNYLNHRKIVVIDGKIGYLGGMNIGDEYMGHFRDNVPWRDTHLRITGSAVKYLQKKFLDDWYYASGERVFIVDAEAEPAGEAAAELEAATEPEAAAAAEAGAITEGKIGMQIVTSGPDSDCEQIKWGFIKMIYAARNKLYIQTPYFIPDDAFLEALKVAAVSGIDIRLMLPEVPDKKFVYNVTTSYLKDLLDFGIKVYLYPGFLHSKMVIMDDSITSIGTTNIDIRSFTLDFEINAFIYDTGFTRQCLDIFEKDAEISRLVNREWYDGRGMLVKFRESLCRLFSPIL